MFLCAPLFSPFARVPRKGPQTRPNLLVIFCEERVNVDCQLMQRQKTEEELNQERLDEEYARKLQDELNAPQPPPPQSTQSPPRVPAVTGSVGGGAVTVQVGCPYCGANNHIPRNTPQGQQFRCGACAQVLPSRRPPGQISSPPPGKSNITCQNCRCVNQVPVGASTQFMCGHCYRLLSFNQQISFTEPPQTFPGMQFPAAGSTHPGPSSAGYPASTAPIPPGHTSPPPQPGQSGDGVVYEGRVTRTVQVRCGQCQTINSIKATGRTVEFTCSSCQSCNEVDL